jgi:hypothetical protein
MKALRILKPWRKFSFYGRFLKVLPKIFKKHLLPKIFLGKKKGLFAQGIPCGAFGSFSLGKQRK